MYAALGTRWGKKAYEVGDKYSPPRLSDVLDLAWKKRRENIDIYIGLSTEGLSARWGNYRAREDFSPELLKEALIFNSRKESNRT